MSWKNGHSIPDRTSYPLLFDRGRQPKPALDAVLAVPLRALGRGDTPVRAVVGRRLRRSRETGKNRI